MSCLVSSENYVFEVMRFRPDSGQPVIFNLSFNTAIVPTVFIEAVVDPILKKDSLDHEVYKNFRPISNLSFISKAT